MSRHGIMRVDNMELKMIEEFINKPQNYEL